jgi:hypothetical protein
MAINDWTNKANEPQVVFSGSFFRLLRWIWNLRITYPDTAILLGDNDITGAFRLIKYNPWVVSMHGFVVDDFLGLATGQTFGDTASPGNFEVAAIARQQHAAYLWAHQSQEVLQRAHTFVQQMTFNTGPRALAFASANADSLNQGVLDAHGHRVPPPFPRQVDDCMFADVPEHMPLTAAASMVALEDIFGEKHPCQEHVLSFDKLNLSFDENRDVVGHHVDTRRMVVGITARRREKIIQFIESEGWLLPKKATIQEIASVYGLLDNASEFFPWARAHLLNLQSLLVDCIRRTYAIAKRSIP